MTAETEIGRLYENNVREWARKSRNDARLVPADLSVRCISPVCGSAVTLDIRHNQEVITELGYQARACTLGMASTAVVVAAAPGCSFSAVHEIGEKLGRLLAGEDVCFAGEWRALEMFIAARSFKARHGSILLPFQVLEDAAEQLKRRL